MYDYIEKYGNLTFEDKMCTEIDLLIFSQIPYIKFNDSISKLGTTLYNAWEAVKKYNNKDKGLIYGNVIKLIDILVTKNRYKDLILFDYVYDIDDRSQFGAITIMTCNNIYVVFEGTDDSISGWKEDFELTYLYPTIAQRKSTKYLKNIIKKYNTNIIVCGHSKGGNLALVGSMKLNIFEKNRINKIYSFDGPGLRKREFKSLNYKLVKNKLINIVPNLSIIGLLLEQENIRVIKSKASGLYQHDVTSWLNEDDKLKICELSPVSSKLDNTISSWLNKHNYKDRKRIIEGVFSIFRNANIESISEIKENRIRTILDIVKYSYNIDNETKGIILGSIKLLLSDISNEIYENSKDKIYTAIDKFLN